MVALGGVGWGAEALTEGACRCSVSDALSRARTLHTVEHKILMFLGFVEAFLCGVGEAGEAPAAHFSRSLFGVARAGACGRGCVLGSRRSNTWSVGPETVCRVEGVTAPQFRSVPRTWLLVALGALAPQATLDLRVIIVSFPYLCRCSDACLRLAK